MKIERTDLEQRFAQLSDEELVDRLRSGNLTAMAREVAEATLRSRGVTDTWIPTEEVLPEDAGGPVASEDMVEVARMLTPTEAHILEARLIAEGIPASVADAHLVQANHLWALAVGGVRVLVPESYVQAAKEIKAAIARGEYALSDSDSENLEQDDQDVDVRE